MNCMAHGHALSKKPKLQGWPQNFLRIMRLTVFLLLTAVLHTSARSLGQTVSYEARGVSLTKIFSVIEKQTGYVFIYNDEDITGTHPVTVRLQSSPLRDALAAVLADQPLSFNINGNTIVISRKQEKKQEKDNLPPPIDIHGRITDSTGAPLGGVNIAIKGKNKGTVTDEKGDFVLKEIAADAVLLISSVGYQSQEIRLAGREEIRVSLRQAVISLQDVVINKGYYTISQRLNTGNVTKVDGTDIQKQPVSDPVMALEGRVPGLYISQYSGIPGAGLIVRLRGQNSIANRNDPLYIIDGVPFSSATLTSPDIGGGAVGNPYNGEGNGLSPFNSLDPSSIESIEVLKDADATAIYGSRGANGVILITTKKGKAGATTASVNIYSGIGKVTRYMDLLNTQQYLEMRHEAFKNDGAVPGGVDYDVNGVWDTARYTDWQKVLIGGNAHFTNVNASVSGGNNNTQFLLGGGYSTQGTVYPGNYADKKISGTLSASHSSSDRKFNASVSVNYVNNNSNLPAVDFSSNVLLAPDAPALYDANHNLNWQPVNGTASWSNPLGITMQHYQAVTDNLISHANLNYSIIPGLQITTSVGYNYIQMSQAGTLPASALPPPYNNNPDRRSVSISNSSNKSWTIEPQLNYQKKIGAGNLEVLVGGTIQQTITTSANYGASGFSSDALLSNPLAGSTQYLGGYYYSQYKYAALFGRIGYNWKEKFLLNLTARRDGSSRFGPDKRYGNFGAIGAGWIFTNENLFRNKFHFLSFGKLRTSYGTAGNDGLGDYVFLSTYTPLGLSFLNTAGLYPTSLTNPGFAWELNKKFEAGLELGFLKDRFNLSVSYYRNRSGNQLVGYSLPAITGFQSIQANLPAIVQNTGLEFQVNTINIKTRNFTWRTSANLTIPRNKLVAFPNIESSTYANQYEVGNALSVRKYYHFLKVNDTTGIYQFESKGGPTNHPLTADRSFTDPITQQWYGGIQNSFQYKGFQLDIFFQFVKQRGFYPSTFIGPGSGRFNQNRPTEVLNRWQAPGDITNIGKFSIKGAADPFRAISSSDYIIDNTSFVRLKNLALSYQFPERWLKSIHLKTGRIYLQCQNLLTFTDYVGLDPETGGSGLSLPPLRMITGGIQFSL